MILAADEKVTKNIKFSINTACDWFSFAFTPTHQRVQGVSTHLFNSQSSLTDGVHTCKVQEEEQEEEAQLLFTKTDRHSAGFTAAAAPSYPHSRPRDRIICGSQMGVRVPLGVREISFIYI